MLTVLNIVAALYAVLIALAILIHDKDGFADPISAIVRGLGTLSLLWLAIYATWGVLS